MIWSPAIGLGGFRLSPVRGHAMLATRRVYLIAVRSRQPFCSSLIAPIVRGEGGRRWPPQVRSRDHSASWGGFGNSTTAILSSRARARPGRSVKPTVPRVIIPPCSLERLAVGREGLS